MRFDIALWVIPLVLGVAACGDRVVLGTVSAADTDAQTADGGTSTSEPFVTSDETSEGHETEDEHEEEETEHAFRDETEALDAPNL